MGLAARGSMHQEIFEDDHEFASRDLRKLEQCFVTIANAEQCIDITGEELPINSYTAQEYSKAELPWFDCFGGDNVQLSVQNARENLSGE